MTSTFASITILIFVPFALTFIMHKAAISAFPQLGLLDHPERYGLSRKPLAYPTGLVCITAFLLLFFLAYPHFSLQDAGLLVGIIMLGIISFIDDRRTLSPKLRLMIHIAIGILIFVTGTRIYTITNPLGGIIKLDSILLTHQFAIPGGPLPVLSGIFTVFWLLLTMNAFNWFDGIPGQVSILTVIGGITLAALSLSASVNQPEIAVIALIVAGIALASAYFEFPPNSVVIGDTGSMFFGLMLGALSIYAGGKVATALLVLGVPLIDALLVIARRIITRTSPFKGNNDHLHHRLLRAGWSEKQIILLTVALGSSFGITALFLSTLQKFIAILLLMAVMIAFRIYSKPHR